MCEFEMTPPVLEVPHTVVTEDALIRFRLVHVVRSGEDTEVLQDREFHGTIDSLLWFEANVFRREGRLNDSIGLVTGKDFVYQSSSSRVGARTRAGAASETAAP